jgi:hypothetical protein
MEQQLLAATATMTPAADAASDGSMATMVFSPIACPPEVPETVTSAHAHAHGGPQPPSALAAAVGPPALRSAAQALVLANAQSTHASSLVTRVRGPASARITAVATSPCGALLATGAADGLVHLYSLRSALAATQPLLLGSVTGPTCAAVTALLVSPAHNLLVVGRVASADVFSLADARFQYAVPVVGPVHALAIAADSPTLVLAHGSHVTVMRGRTVTASWDTTHFHDENTRPLLPMLAQSLAGAAPAQMQAQAHALRSQAVLARAADCDTDLESRRALYCRVTSVCVVPAAAGGDDDRCIATGHADGTLRIWTLCSRPTFSRIVRRVASCVGSAPVSASTPAASPLSVATPGSGAHVGISGSLNYDSTPAPSPGSSVHAHRHRACIHFKGVPAARCAEELLYDDCSSLCPRLPSLARNPHLYIEALAPTVAASGAAPLHLGDLAGVAHGDCIPVLRTSTRAHAAAVTHVSAVAEDDADGRTPPESAHAPALPRTFAWENPRDRDRERDRERGCGAGLVTGDAGGGVMWWDMDKHRHWVPDSAVSSCAECGVTFTTLRRKHHCRACGMVQCGKCSSKTAPVPQLGIFQHTRVCLSCYQTLN